MDERDERRAAFAERIHRPDEPCWMWRGYLNKKGYGVFIHHNRRRFAHREAYELFVGPIPSGLEVHHECFNRACVNPAHLKVVTKDENLRQSRSLGSVNRAKTRCPRGHKYDAVNNKGHRICRTCKRASVREAQRKRKGYYERDRSLCRKQLHRWSGKNVGLDHRGRRFCRACKADAAKLRRGKPKPHVRPKRCPHGHRLTPENTYVYPGTSRYYCRTCNRDAARVRYVSR